MRDDFFRGGELRILFGPLSVCLCVSPVSSFVPVPGHNGRVFFFFVGGAFSGHMCLGLEPPVFFFHLD